MKRLFLAINLPKATKQEIFLLYKNYKNPDIKWTWIDNLHITIKFIGDVDETNIKELQNFLKQNIIIEKIKLKINNTLFFPNIDDPRIIALECEINKETKNKIIEFINKLEKFSFIKKEKNISFKPHITIGRVKNEIDKSKYNFTYKKEIEITNIELMESTLTYNSPIYKVIEMYKLQ